MRWGLHFSAGEGSWRQDWSGCWGVTGRPSSGSIKTGYGNTVVVTLSDGGGEATPPLKAGVVVTLGDGWGLMSGLVVRRYDSTTVRMGCVATEDSGKMAVLNILERSLMTWSWASPNFPNGPAGTGLARASAKACASTTAASLDEFLGIGQEARKIVSFAQCVLLE